MLSNLGRVGRWDGISTTNCYLSPAVPVSWPPTLNLHKPPELLSIHTIKRVEMTALAFCQPAKLAFYKAASICWLHPLHLLERKLNNLSRWLRRSQYSPSLGTASSPNTQTHAVLIHHSLLFLVQFSQSTGLSQPTSAFSASLLLLSAVQWSGYFKSEQWGKHLPQIPYEWKNWLPWKSLQEGMCVFKGHKLCYPPSSLHQTLLAYKYLSYTLISHLKSIYIPLLHQVFIGGNVLFEYVFQAQIQNQMQKKSGNYPNFAI